MKFKKNKTTAVGTPIVIGLIISALFAILALSFVSYLLLNEKISLNAIPGITNAVQGLAAAIGGIACVNISQKTALLIPIIHSTALFGLMVIGNLLFVNDGVHISIGSVIALAGAIGVNFLLIQNSRSGKKVKIRKR